MISHHAALIYTMVLCSASDRNMTDAELETIGETIGHLPVFQRLRPQPAAADTARLAPSCWTIEDGLEQARWR